MDTSTALAFVIPLEFHDKINEIRSKNDKAFQRWMPHINFIFPFVPLSEFDTIGSRLEDELQYTLAFDLHLDEIGYFDQGEKVTIHLKTSNESKLLKLNNQIKKVCSKNQSKNQFHPHVTIGQFIKKDLEEILIELKKWLGDGFKCRVNQISFLHRSPETDDKMAVRKIISLQE